MFDIGTATTLIVFLVGIGIGLPIGWLFVGSTALGLFITSSPATFIANTFFHSLDSITIMAIAFFVFSGALISEAGLADRIVSFSYSLVGRLKGGLTAVGIVATLFLGALTGSSVPCIAALIPLLVPRLETFGYKRVYTTAILCSSSYLGYLIPPSVPAMIYCLLAGQSVAALFLATVVPGLLLALGYGILNYCMVNKYTFESTEKPKLPETISESIKDILHTGRIAIPALGCPVIIMVGIYGGIFTPNEAGGIAAVYCLLIGWFVYRELTNEKLARALSSTIGTFGMTTLLLAGGTVLTRYLTRQGVAQDIAAFMLSLFENKILILLMLNVFLLILGMFLDGIPILILVVPLVLPLMNELNVNLVHLGAMMVVNVGIGVMTPPFAMSIFVGSRLGNVSPAALTKVMIPFLLFVSLPVLFLTTYIPALSCWLPKLLLGASVVGPW
ncbi:TRAP transporter large permease [Aminivibrio sp.]|jgi:C4-dicarboxylate transporter DctM subunit|uniref:TRAP transporter large permease n=1 Tax=Aminivibrio sp. TaxID=1872489 RepID=UPI002A6EB3E8|nr:TRAP transporter large permease [Caldisericia bacterium]MDD4614710.1 TRAP transporter large permease [Caldisericia bacterium]